MAYFTKWVGALAGALRGCGGRPEAPKGSDGQSDGGVGSNSGVLVGMQSVGSVPVATFGQVGQDIYGDRHFVYGDVGIMSVPDFVSSPGSQSGSSPISISAGCYYWAVKPSSGLCVVFAVSGDVVVCVNSARPDLVHVGAVSIIGMIEKPVGY